MGQVVLSLPSDGTTIDASDVNTPFNTLVNEFNGNIDDNNIKTGANISGAKLNDASIPGKKFDSTTYGGWIAGVLPAVSSVTNNGQRSYDVTFASTVASYLTPGMRLRFTPTTTRSGYQCTSLNGTTQYWVKTSPNKLTFIDDFVVSAWVKLTSYGNTCIASRYDGTSGWSFEINSSGQLILIGYSGGAANFRYVQSYQSVPLNKWVHLAAELDMSGYSTVSATTSYTMIDGVDVPASMGQGGTNPASLTQAGTLQIGAKNATNFFPGKIAQVAIYNAKVTQATILASINQGLTGSETSLASAYSFNNSTTDLNTSTPNDLSAGAGSPTATNADAPFSVDANGTVGSYDYGIVTKVSTTVATVQVPEGNTIPTSGGVSAVDFSPWKAPLGMPVGKDRWRIVSLTLNSVSVSFSATNTWTVTNATLLVPVGSWGRLGYQGPGWLKSTGAGVRTGHFLLSPATPTNAVHTSELNSRLYNSATTANTDYIVSLNKDTSTELSTATTYLMYADVTVSSGVETFYIGGAEAPFTIYAEPAYL